MHFLRMSVYQRVYEEICCGAGSGSERCIQKHGEGQGHKHKLKYVNTDVFVSTRNACMY